MNRSEAAREIARVFAYLGCGKLDKARESATLLVAWLTSI